MTPRDPNSPPRLAKGIYPSPEQIDPGVPALGMWQDEALIYSILPWRRRRAYARIAQREAEIEKSLEKYRN